MQYRLLKDLKKYPNNPRFIKDDQFLKLVESVKNNKEYFEARPLILSNRTGELVIIAGNQRYEASKHLKLKEVPTHLIEGLTEEKEREIVIRDNVNNGDWDHDILSASFDVEELAQWGVNLDFMKEGPDEEEKEEEKLKTMTLEYSETEYLKVKKAVKDSGKSAERILYEALIGQ